MARKRMPRDELEVTLKVRLDLRYPHPREYLVATLQDGADVVERGGTIPRAKARVAAEALRLLATAVFYKATEQTPNAKIAEHADRLLQMGTREVKTAVLDAMTANGIAYTESSYNAIRRALQRIRVARKTRKGGSRRTKERRVSR